MFGNREIKVLLAEGEAEFISAPAGPGMSAVAFAQGGDPGDAQKLFTKEA